MDAKETSIFTAVLISCIIVLVLIIFFTVTIIRYQRRSLLLYRAKVLAEITTLENERRRVSADLHDELGPIVAGIQLKLNSLDITNTEDLQTIGNINRHISDLIGRMKGISNDLMPVLLLKKGLVVALERVVEDFNKTGSLAIDLRTQDVPPVPEDIAINLYRILQEVIHNTVKHAGASRLVIQLRAEKNWLHLTTTDDGVGFDYRTAARDHTGLGLRNLLSRTEILAGHMYVESGKGRGTVYDFEIPL
jgi:signal transduction histidine kinase